MDRHTYHFHIVVSDRYPGGNYTFSCKFHHEYTPGFEPQSLYAKLKAAVIDEDIKPITKAAQSAVMRSVHKGVKDKNFHTVSRPIGKNRHEASLYVGASDMLIARGEGNTHLEACEAMKEDAAARK